MCAIKHKYRNPVWLPGGHIQTIFPALIVKKANIKYRRERWTTDDGDFIDVDFVDGEVGKPVVVVFHGLEGSSESQYARTFMSYLQGLGWTGAIAHFRSCSGEINHGPRFYHSGDTQEMDWVLQRLREYKDKMQAPRYFAVGFSLGGNVLLRWLGESQHHGEILDAACAICAPHCLTAGGVAISKGLNQVYERMFLKTLKSKAFKKLEQFPGLYDGEKLKLINRFYDFDNLVTAPLHGFRDTDDYWDRSSAKHVVNDIMVPTLVLNAQNDPLVPFYSVPRTAAPSVKLEFPVSGGHVGFTSGPMPGHVNWLPERILSFLEGRD